MDLSDSPEEAEFRGKARAWLQQNRPEGIADRGFALAIDAETVKLLTQWQRRLYEGGYLGLSWPVEYGGQGKTIIESAIFNEEMARVRAPAPLNELGLSMGAPTILEHGTDEQKKRFIKKILTCEEVWCQGFSEPASGSDMAALQTRAVMQGDEFIVNGQKVWTSLGHLADWCMLLVRTDSHGTEAQGDIVSAGRYAQSGRDGAAAAADDGRGGVQPDVLRGRACAAGEPAGTAQRRLGRGANDADERARDAGAGHVMRFHNVFEDLAELARRVMREGRCPMDARVVRQTLAQFYVDVESMKYLAYRNFSRLTRGGIAGARGFDLEGAVERAESADERVRAGAAGAARDVDGGFGARGRRRALAVRSVAIAREHDRRGHVGSAARNYRGASTGIAQGILEARPTRRACDKAWRLLD